MKPRIPLAYAGLLIIALVAVVGFAAFSPSDSESATSTTEAPEAVAQTPSASARVASAILALRVSDAESRTATTQGSTTPASEGEDIEAATEAVSTAEAAPATEATSPSSTSTTNAPSTTEAPTTTQPAPPRDTTPPPLSIAFPSDGTTVTDNVVIFEGSTEPGATVSSGPYAAEVDSDGEWTVTLVLASGANGALITATDSAGNETSKRIVVYYEPPSTTTTTSGSSVTTTTTATSSAPKWSPLWPADAGGRRNVEAWRPLVEKYWPAELVSCALNIIDMESGGDPRAYNSRTSAEGLFQHLSKYWKGRAAAAGFKDSDGLYATPYHAEANIAAAWVIARGSDPWHRPWTVNPYYGDCTE